MTEENKDQPANPPTTALVLKEFKPLADLKAVEGNRKQFQTNFKGEGLEAAKFLTQALATEGIRLDEAGSDCFMCKYYIAHIAEYVAQDGEVIPMPRVVLISGDGATMQFVSEGGIDSFDVIRSLCGDGPWEPPLPISVVPVRTRRGFRTYRLCLGSPPKHAKQSAMAGRGDEQEGQAGTEEPRKRSRG